MPTGLLPHLSASQSSHLWVIWGGAPHAILPPPAPSAAGEVPLRAQRRAEAVHRHMLIQQTAETETQASASKRDNEMNVLFLLTGKLWLICEKFSFSVFDRYSLC